MFKTRTLVLTLMMLCLMLGLAPGSVAASTHYRNSRIAFDLPDDWSGPASGDLTADGGVTYRSGDAALAMNIVATPLPPNATLDDLVQATIVDFATSPGYEGDPDGRQSDTIGGEPAFTFTFWSNNRAGTRIETITYFAVHNGLVYAVTFAADPDDDQASEMAQAIVDSFQFM